LGLPGDSSPVAEHFYETFNGLAGLTKVIKSLASFQLSNKLVNPWTNNARDSSSLLAAVQE